MGWWVQGVEFGWQAWTRGWRGLERGFGEIFLYSSCLFWFSLVFFCLLLQTSCLVLLLLVLVLTRKLRWMNGVFFFLLSFSKLLGFFELQYCYCMPPHSSTHSFLPCRREWGIWFWLWLWLWLWLARLWTLGFDWFQSTLFTLASLTQPDGDGRGKSANTENVLQVQFVPQILSAKKLQCLARRVRDLPDDGLCYTDCPGPHLTWYYL